MTKIDDHIKDLEKLCVLYNVEKMYLFGSAATSNLTNKSDIDLLVKFKTFQSDYFDNFLNFKEQLMSLFGRDIDLLEEQALRNPILINSINKSKKLVYG